MYCACDLFGRSYLRSLFSLIRTLTAFETWLKKGGKSTDYLLPTEMLVMMNVIIDFKAQVGSLP